MCNRDISDKFSDLQIYSEDYDLGFDLWVTYCPESNSFDLEAST